MPPKRMIKKNKRVNVAKIAKAVVKRELAKELEDKYQITHLKNDQGVYLKDVTADARSDLPLFYPMAQTDQGTNASERIGNEIIPKSHTLEGYCYLNQANAEGSNNDLSQVTVVKVYIGLVRAVSSASAVVGNAPDCTLSEDQLLRDQDGKIQDFRAYGTSGYIQPISEDLLKMNDRYFKPIKTLRFMLGKNVGVLGTDNPPISGAYKMSHKFSVNLTKHLPKKLVYSTNIATAPQNYMPVVYAVAYNAFNGALVSTPQIAMRSTVKYTDA